MSPGVLPIAPRVRPRRIRRDTDPPLLPHWSDVPPRRSPDDEPVCLPLTPTAAAALRDLVSWAADTALVLTRGCPEDRAAIEQVRTFAHAWLAGKPCPELEMHDVLVTAAALMSGIDLRLKRALSKRDYNSRDVFADALIV
jgi:hypothetical protein